MKLYEQEDHSIKRKSKTDKILRRFKHKAERKAAKKDPENHVPTYNKFKGYST